MKTVLELESACITFGGVAAMSSIDLTVGEGEIVSVIGPNGAGKTTLFNLITGVYKPTEGDLRFNGKSLVSMNSTQIVEAGIARTFQSIRLFLDMTVRENVKVATYGSTTAGPIATALGTRKARREEREVEEKVADVLGFFGQRLMGYRWDQPAHVLSYANRRRLEIARAMATGATLLLLDEPAAGMNPEESREIAELIAKLRDERGYTIVVIEHDMGVVERISDRIVALDHGVKITEGTYDEVSNHPEVVESYLGRDAQAEQE